MQWRWLAVRAVCTWAAIAPWTGQAQQAPATPPVSTEDALHSMSDRAGVIFVGTVTAIHHVASDGRSSGAVEITFAVEQALHGVTGSTYTVREWAGLWMANDQRYRVGQHLLMLLNAPGPSGLSTPVDGLDGAIPVSGTGPAVHPGSSSTASPSAAVADLRWVAAHVARPLFYATPLTGVHGSPLQGIARVQQASSAASASATATAVPPAQQAPISTVVSLIASWSVEHAR